MSIVGEQGLTTTFSYPPAYPGECVMRADQNEFRATLTKLAIDRVGPKPARFEMADAKVIGLRLVVQPSGYKSWCVRFGFQGRDRKLTLSFMPTLGFAAIPHRRAHWIGHAAIESKFLAGG